MIVGTFTHQCQGSPDKDYSTCVGPGITLHDVRLAIQTEKLYYTINPESSFDVKPGTPMTIRDVLASHRYANERFKKQLAWTKLFPPLIPVHSSVKAALPDEDASKKYCTDTDFSRTIVPLYGSGWSIVYKGHRNVSDKVTGLKIPTLTGFYKFKSFEDAMSFAQDVMTTLEGQDCVCSLHLERTH